MLPVWWVRVRVMLGISDERGDGESWCEERSLCERWRGGVVVSEDFVSCRFPGIGVGDLDDVLLPLPLFSWDEEVVICGSSVVLFTASLAFVMVLIPSVGAK